MNTIHLHGELGRLFGAHYDLEVVDAREAVRALCLQLDGFEQKIRDGSWRVIRGSQDSGMDLDVDSLSLKLGKSDLHIIPAAEGAGDGAGKIIVGGLMIAAAVMVPGLGTAATVALASAGAGMAVAGVVTMITPIPETGDYESKEKDEQSFLFDGPVNVNKQGVAVPLIYGETVTGSVVISAGIKAEDIPVGEEEDGDE